MTIEKPEHLFSRVSPDILPHLMFCVNETVAEDTREAFERDFPPEVLQWWSAVELSLADGIMCLHELRHAKTGELLSARLMVYYDARNKQERPFVLAAWSVTPQGNPAANQSIAGKGKGYGSLLLKLSVEMIRKNHPEVFAFVSEHQYNMYKDQPDKVAALAKWHKRNGFARVEDFHYEVPPFMPYEHAPDKYIPVYERGLPSPGELLILPLNQSQSITGERLISIVERLYNFGYDVKYTDPYMTQRIDTIDRRKSYTLENVTPLL
ncbi:MAG TPA: hypothetical protein V6D22_21920 [Candidatus Obscuribacterales bacterium]